MKASTTLRNLTQAALQILTIAALINLTACDQKLLCYDHFQHAPHLNFKIIADYQPDWEEPLEGGTNWKENWEAVNYPLPYDSLRPHIPNGLRVIDYYSDFSNTSNLPAYGGDIGLHEGIHSLICFNNNTQYIVFNNLESFTEAKITTRPRSRSTYTGSPFINGGNSPQTTQEQTINPPDVLFASFISDFKAAAAVDTQYIYAHMQPLVFSYLIRFHVTKGLEYVTLSRGALAGMAASVYLMDGHTEENDVATILFDAQTTDDHIEAIVQSFGLPGYPNFIYNPTQTTSTTGLNLEVKLVNGKILSFDFDITQQMQMQPRGGVIDVGGIEISEEDAKEASGTFEVNIDGWGDYQDVPLMF